ncbi:MAG: Regulatory protein GntR [Myxococcaceae bacterium]|nr:Regulatory protein GntR [Myxococcaceae bacterium]
MLAPQDWIIQFAEVSFQRLSTSDAETKSLPDRIAEHFIARIFTGDLAAGERLPPDRELSLMLGVDRTSLRMAMQQLSRMRLVRAVRGSGVHVLDYREHAGLDFLASVFSLPQLSLGGSYLLQVLDDWIELMPIIIGRALLRSTYEDQRALDAIIGEQLEELAATASIERLVDLEIALQDRITRMVGNTGLMLLANSSRPLRLRVVRLYFELIDVREHIEAQQMMLRAAAGITPAAAPAVASAYRGFLVARTAPLRTHLQSLPVSPALLVSPAKPARARGKSRKSVQPAAPRSSMRPKRRAS